MKIAIEIVSRLLWLGVMVVAGFAAFGYILAVFTAKEISAPQQAALAAGTLVWVIFPYVIARGFDEFARDSKLQPETVAPRDGSLSLRSYPEA